MNTAGIFSGVLALLIIGMGFPLVIHSERRLGYLCWPYMLGTGIALIGLSLFIPGHWISIITGLSGATFVWGSTELKDQAVRAELGWFTFNPHKARLPFGENIKKWKPPHL